MTDRDSLLAAITAHPEEDTPRLVYADWLEEHDQAERAEFIRLQCRLEHLSRKSAEGKQLAKREKELRKKLFSHIDALGFAEVSFRRGFVGRIIDSLETLHPKLTQLPTEDAPAYELKLGIDEEESAEYFLMEHETRELFAEPVLRQCVSLDLPSMGMGSTKTILQCPHLVNLRRLNFPDNEGGPGIELIASPIFANLRWANFNNSDSASDNPSIVPLAESPHLANLEYLNFGICEQWTECLLAVAAAPYWNRLRYLNLFGSAFSLDSVAALFNTQHLPALAELDLFSTFGEYPKGSSTPSGDPFAAVIADSPLFARLSKLWLGYNNITDAGAEALAKSPREVKLTLLEFADNPISEVGRQALLERFGEDVCVFERTKDHE